eukprot:CAMPEP_0118962576 /NCGR_PEP_ID=MMETSP1173-20130426/865_1 /TAXON_ID=1034831 /ORGANISM="Rhizochromulina marina cf, Strain CCMP1243" /LENGTH=208 /DNA_ID=CAMNT_0006910859 /DNA_START=36 /DNA_END=662 /DNA_ORIENTATION=-
MLARSGLQRLAAPARAVPARAFAEASHAPPVKLFGIHARYANATYVAASKKKALDQVATELAGFKELLSKNAQFAEYLSNPTVSRAAKVSAVDKLFEGPKTSDVTKNLMVTLASNARIGEAGKVADAYAELMKASRGELDAVITTASKLTKAQENKVVDSLKKQANGRKVSISTVVDPSILGGLTVQIGDQFLDLSAKSRIGQVTRSL